MKLSTCGMIIVLAAALAAPAQASRKATSFPLEFRPTSESAHVGQLLPEAMTRLPGAVQVRDGRGLEDAAVIGTRSDDGDTIHTLRATNEIPAFVRDAVQELMRQWRVPTGADAPRVLDLELVKLRVTETDKAVGATYEAEAQFNVVLRDAAGTALWTAQIFGDATRYGRARSQENTREVISDALLEAIVSAFEHRNLQAAWVSGTPVVPPATASTPRD